MVRAMDSELADRGRQSRRERELGPVMDRITVPTRYVLASGTSFGSKGDGQEKIHAESGNQGVAGRRLDVSGSVVDEGW